LGTIFAQTFFIPKFSVKINHAVSLLIFSSSAIILTVKRRSFRTRVFTFFDDFIHFDVVRRPGRLSHSTSSLPLEKCLHQSNTCFLHSLDLSRQICYCIEFTHIPISGSTRQRPQWPTLHSAASLVI
jgi:hypothetical protein